MLFRFLDSKYTISKRTKTNEKGIKHLFCRRFDVKKVFVPIFYKFVSKKMKLEEQIQLLTTAFDKGISANYFVKQDMYRIDRMKFMHFYSIAATKNYGKIFTIENKAIALTIPDAKFKVSLLMKLKLIYYSLGIKKTPDVLYNRRIVKKFHKANYKNFIWIWSIAAAPEFQKQGYATKLLLEIENYYKTDIALETTTPELRDFYIKNGFTFISKIAVRGYDLYFLYKKSERKM